MMHFHRVASDLSLAYLLATAGLLLLSGCDTSRGSKVTKTSIAAETKPAAVSGRSATTLEQAATASATKPRPPLPPGAPTKALAAAGNRPYDKTFDDIKFEMQVAEPFKRDMLTPAIEDLVGDRIRIRGFILPTAQKRGIKQFVLVRDNQECCFGPGAALYDCIFVEMQPGKTAEFSIRPVAVLGTFSVDEVIGPDGNHWAVYRIDAEEVGQ